MIRVYDAWDDGCAGMSLGAVFPETDSAQVQEDAGGEYVLRMTVPIAPETGWQLLALDRQITAPCPVLAGIREQIFRIHAIAVGDTGQTVNVQARHISYDLQYRITGNVEAADKKITAAEAGDRLWASIREGSGGFTLSVEVDSMLRCSWKQISVIRALLDPSGGLAALSRARLVRDNKSIRLMPSDNLGSGVIIRYGVNMIGLNADGDLTETYTRFLPIGQDKKGNPLQLPEVTIDSPRISDYALPRTLAWQVPGARVGSKHTLDDGSEKRLTLDDVYDLLREAAQEKMKTGCDLPTASTTVEYIDLGRTKEHPELAGLQEIKLYETVTSIHDRIGLRLEKPVCGYLWDPVALRYTQLKLGDPFRDTGKDSFVTSSQRAADARGYAAAGMAIQTELQDHASFVENQITYNNAVLIELDALDGRILQMATSEQVGELETSLNTVILELDAMEGELSAKVSNVTYEEQVRTTAQAMLQLDADIDAEVLAREQLATDVTASFAALTAKVDANEASISTLATDTEGAIAALTTRVGDNEASISAMSTDLGSRITLLAEEIELAGYVTATELSASLADFDAAMALDFDTVNLGAVNGDIEDLHGYSLDYSTGAFTELTVGGVAVSLEGHTHNYAAKSHTHSGYMASNYVSTSSASTAYRFVLSVGNSNNTVSRATHTHTVTIDGVTYTTSRAS